MDTAMFAIVVALATGIASMPLNVYEVCAWNIGTIRAEPWHVRTSLYRGASRLRSWIRSFMREDGFISVDALTAGGGKRREKDPPTIVHAGSVITLPSEPTKMGLRKAIQWLEKMAEEEEKMIVVRETIDAYPWDGARALSIAIKQRFGFASAQGQGWNPPQQISVATDVGVEESVAWGGFNVPGIEGTLYTGTTYAPNGQTVFQLTAEVKKKDAPIVSELAELTREILKTDSIYRGKAVRFTVDSDGDAKPPEFVDLSRVNPSELVFSLEVLEQIETTIFAPIQRREWCKALGIPFKRGVCLLGAYGVGKTLAVYVAAQMAKHNGITFVLVEDPETLPQAMNFARQYAPAVVAAEDIDRVTRERNDTCNDIMDALDGVEAKDTEVMVLFTSNHADDIHEAMRRPGRIDTFIKVAAPDAPAVEKLIRLYGRGLVHADENLMEPCELLAGQIPAVIREVVERAKLAAVARADSLHDARQLTGNDLKVAARRLLMQQELFAPKTDDGTAVLKRALVTVGEALTTPVPRNFDLKLTNGREGKISATK